MPKELPKFSYLITAVIFGILMGIGLYQLSSKGILNLNFNNLPKIETPQIQKIQTVLSEENAVIAVVEKSSPSVVAIGTNGIGFIVSEKGIIVTNKHVVAGNNIYNVVTVDGKKFEVRKIYKDPILDLAVLQIDEGGLKALDLGNSANLKVGQTVIAMGNIVTTGVVSSLGEQISTDTIINPGNSGGPLLNSMGQVIGVNVATTNGPLNIGFAIPIDSVKKIINEFVDKGAVSKPYLGIKYKFINKENALLNKIPEGALIQEIIIGSPAEKAEIKVGDIITKINGQAILSEAQITDFISSKSIGDIMSLTLWNNGKERSIVATLQELVN